MKNLASQVRPNSLKDIIGQSKYLNNNGILAKMVERNYMFSLILYSPPGMGKTSIATCLANDLNIPFSFFNASLDSKSKLIDIINESKNYERYIVIIDEIHRLHKDKQDILLPILEKNEIFIIATTTENPYFTINPAIRSRCKILELSPISSQELFEGIKKVIKNNNLEIKISDELIKIIADYASGDIRTALNILDLLINLYPDTEIDINTLNIIIDSKIILGSHYGDELHNLKSAFHKSLRGSDPDATLYYLSRLLDINALEDVTRRMLVMAYEDIGLANPQLCARVSSGIESVYRVGLPEAKHILANLCVQMALSPKSNSTSLAIENVEQELLTNEKYAIPKHLWDSHYKSAVKLGVSGYKYPHDYMNHYVEQQYLPTKLIGKKFYFADSNDYEKKINDYLNKIKKTRNDS